MVRVKLPDGVLELCLRGCYGLEGCWDLGVWVLGLGSVARGPEAVGCEIVDGMDMTEIQ